MTHQTANLAPAEIATAVHNNLRTRFFEVHKTDSKQLFIAIQRGDAIPFIEISVGDQGTVRCDLRLDDGQFKGNLNFSRFRRALDAHLKRLSDALQGDKGLNIYRSDDFKGLVYNHPGAIEDDGQVNFLVSSLHQKSPGVVHLLLFFVDPEILGL